jgi:hypothetical protein
MCRACDRVRRSFEMHPFYWSILTFRLKQLVHFFQRKQVQLEFAFDRWSAPSLFYAAMVLTLIAFSVTLVGCSTRFDGEVKKTRNSQPQGGENEKSDRTPPKPVN